MLRPILLPLALFAAATPGLAAPQAEFISRRVSFADLDLSTEAGRATLDRRVERAVRQVCDIAYDLETQAEVRRCRDEARARAKVQIAAAVTRHGGAVELAMRGR